MLKRAIIILLVSGLFSLLISSCCTDVYIVTSDFTVGFSDYTNGKTISPMTDTIRGPFRYSLGAGVIIGGLDLSGFSTIASTYAYQCGKTYENGYRTETASVVLDKAFYLDGELISPGTNLLEIDKDHGENRFDTNTSEINAQVSVTGITILFKDEFMHRFSFPLENYTFKTMVEMEDGTLIQSEETVAISIN